MSPVFERLFVYKQNYKTNYCKYYKKNKHIQIKFENLQKVLYIPKYSKLGKTNVFQTKAPSKKPKKTNFILN